MTGSIELHGRVAVVTGASSGIGEQIARELADSGAAVALLARRADKLESIADGIRRVGGAARAYAIDVTDAVAMTAIAQTIADDLGAIGIVVNNAGIMLPTPVTRVAPDDWQRQVALNIGALNNVVVAFVEQLISTAASAGVADLVNTASIAGKQLFPTFSAYAASKAYAIHLGNNLRTELGPKNVRVTTIEPGIVATELQEHIADDAVRRRLSATRETIEWLTPADVARVVIFAVGLPARVNLPEIAILPTRQTT